MLASQTISYKHIDAYQCKSIRKRWLPLQRFSPTPLVFNVINSSCKQPHPLQHNAKGGCALHKLNSSIREFLLFGGTLYYKPVINTQLNNPQLLPAIYPHKCEACLTNMLLYYVQECTPLWYQHTDGSCLFEVCQWPINNYQNLVILCTKWLMVVHQTDSFSTTTNKTEKNSLVHNILRLLTTCRVNFDVELLRVKQRLWTLMQSLLLRRTKEWW